AEDGIRGFHVTGVQTCALPIEYAALFLSIFFWSVGSRRNVLRERDGDGGAGALLALYPDRSVHHIDEAFRDGQAEAASFVGARMAARFLPELGKDVWKKIRADADSRVLYGDDSVGFVGVEGQGYAAGGGELDGVGEEVVEDADGRAAVDERHGRLPVTHVAGQLEAACDGLMLEPIVRRPDDLCEVGGLGFKSKGIHFELGEVEHRVERIHESAAALPDELDELDVLGVDLVGEDVGETDDRRQRRPDLMAHVRQERGLQPGHFFGAVPGFDQAVFVFLPFGGVSYDGLGDVFVGEPYTDLDGERGAVLAPEQPFEADGAFIGTGIPIEPGRLLVGGGVEVL